MRITHEWKMVQSISQSINRSIDQSINRSIDQSINQSMMNQSKCFSGYDITDELIDLGVFFQSKRPREDG